LSSMLEAFVFLPSHFAHWGAAPKQKRGESFFGRQTKRFAGMIESIYLHKYLIGIVSLLTALAVLSLTVIIRRDLFQGDQYSRFYIDMELAPGAPREKTRDVALEFESKILPLIGKGNVQAVSTAIGLAVKENEFLRQNNVAQLQVDVVERAERQKSIEDIIDDIQALTDTIPGVASVQFRTVQGGPPVDPPVSFRLFGDDYNDLSTIANQFQNLLSDYKGVYNITDDLERGKPELLIRVNNERAEQLGLNVTTIGSHVRTGITGTDATTFYRNNEEIDVVVSYDPEKQKSVQAVTAMHFPTRDPQMPFIPFTSVANTNQDQGIAAIKRVDARRQIQVTAESQPMVDIPAINKDIMKYFEREVREQYPGITLKLGGEFSEFQNILQQIAQLFLIGIFLIYLILGTQFQSYSQPILILFSIPFSFSGVVLYLLLTNTAFSSTVMYAGVALAGIAVNDAIVSISFINDRRKEGRSLMDAIREGASVRLRPIVLTSFTTMAGLLPMAVGIGGRSPVWGPMAATIIFGLIFSTTTTLIIMPCWYGIFEAIKIGRKKKKKGA
ncbi:MAG: efflux RND transporter permease subunit, partial [Chitinivibrionales bacterium]